LGQFGRTFGGIEAKVDDKCLGLLSPKVVEKLGYVMGIVRERAGSARITL